jgi:Fe-S-cluster containining protein
VAAYRRGLAFVDRAFERARTRSGLTVPCRRGCNSCCAALFDVHEADAALLRDWLSRRREAEREQVLRRAEAVVREVERARDDLLAAGEWALDGWDPLRDPLDRLPSAVATRLAAEVPSPCPLLGEEGDCRAHADRPAICRLQGLPWRDPATGGTVADFCRLEPGMESNPPQALDLARLDALRHETAEALRGAADGSESSPGRRFVAAALLS